MATNAGTIFVELQARIDKFKKNLGAAQKGMKSFATKTANFVANNKLVIGAALAGLGAGIAKTIKMYGIQEQAIVSLNQSLKNQGALTDETSRDLQDYASSIQRVTTFGDEVVIGLQSQLVNFGLLGDELKTATQATLDMAVATGTDLKAAALLVGKAFKGETGSLSRYGIILDKGIPKAEKFTNALVKMNEMFGGQAQAQRETTLGQFKAMGNAFGDLQETIGSFLAGEGNSLVVMITKWIERIDSSLKSIKTFANESGGFLKLLSENFINLIGVFILGMQSVMLKIPGMNLLLRSMGTTVDEVKESTEDAIASTQVLVNNFTRRFIKDEDKKQEKILETKDVKQIAEAEESEQTKTIWDEKREAWIEMKQEEIAWDKKAKEILGIQQNQWAISAQQLAGQVFDQFGSGIADMIMDGRRFSDVMKSIWKDLARAVIAEIAKMIAKWFVFMALRKAATAGFFGGGFQQGGIISEPSVITGLRSGVSHIAGEAGEEVVMPIQKFKGGRRNQAINAAQLGAGTAPVEQQEEGGGMSITINIQGQFIEGNEARWQKLIRDRIVPEVRRFTMASPLGPFRRRRGMA